MNNFNIEISSSNSDRVFLNKELFPSEIEGTVRKHNFLASIFFRIFGSGIVTLKGVEGKKYYINKRSLINFCCRHGTAIAALGKFDEKTLINRVKTIIESSKCKQEHYKKMNSPLESISIEAKAENAQADTKNTKIVKADLEELNQAFEDAIKSGDTDTLIMLLGDESFKPTPKQFNQVFDIAINTPNFNVLKAVLKDERFKPTVEQRNKAHDVSLAAYMKNGMKTAEEVVKILQDKSQQ